MISICSEDSKKVAYTCLEKQNTEQKCQDVLFVSLPKTAVLSQIVLSPSRFFSSQHPEIC